MRTLYLLLIICFKGIAQQNVTMPIFPECEESIELKKCFQNTIAKYLIKGTELNLLNQEQIKNLNKKDIREIICYFTIDNKGKTKKVRVKGKFNKDILKKLKENLKKLPKLKPGTYNGKPIDLPFTLPVFFSVSD